jgi:ribose transport system substrate-binding protein
VQAAEREVDAERQLQIVENLVQRRVAVLLIVPSGSREIVPAIVKANAANIPVAVVDTRVDTAALRAAGGRVATFVGSDNVDGGRLAGRFLARRLGGAGRVAVLEGVPGHESGDARLRGFREALAEAPGMTIVASQPADMERDRAFQVTQNVLQAHPDVQAVFACNDVMALGAVEAIAAAGRAGQGHRRRLRRAGRRARRHPRGRMHATVAQFPAEMGRRAVESAWRLSRGERAGGAAGAIELVTSEAASCEPAKPT